MKKLEDAIENVKYGAMLTINKDMHNVKTNEYSGCVSLYDGRILKDVKSVKLGDFLTMIPNIVQELDQGYIYQVKYLFEEKKYQSIIIRKVREGGYKEPYKYEKVKDYEVISETFLDSILELDIRIATFNSLDEIKTKRIGVA